MAVDRGRTQSGGRRSVRPFEVSARRGELRLVDSGEPAGSEQAGHRPAMVVAADRLNESHAGVIIVVPCTTHRRELPSHIESDPENSGLGQISYPECEDITSIPKRRLIVRLCVVNEEALVQRACAAVPPRTRPRAAGSSALVTAGRYPRLSAFDNGSKGGGRAGPRPGSTARPSCAWSGSTATPRVRCRVTDLPWRCRAATFLRYGRHAQR